MVATDVAVPERVDRVRFDVYTASGALAQTRTVPTLSPIDWPLSFALVSTDVDEERVAWVRVRAYRAETARGEAFVTAPSPPWTEPAIASSLEDACATEPELHAGESVTLRRGDRAITSMLASSSPTGQTCTDPTISGSVAARVVITQPDTYVLEVSSVVPDPARDGPGGDATLAVRTRCDVPTSQIACEMTRGGHPPRIEVKLDPGTYHLVTGGGDRAFADLTLRVRLKNAITATSPDAGAPTTPDEEPPIPTTIDRLVAVRIVPGTRGRVEVALHGECFGTPADLGTKQSCGDRAGEVAAVPVTYVVPALDRTSATTTATWPADRPAACTAAPRDGEACVPGGVFVLGDDLALGDGDFRTQPQRVRAMDAFLLDVHEVSVGRFRDALAHGLVLPVIGDPVANDGAIRPENACTWTANAGDHESFPITCISWENARAFCRFSGGDLPTEDQWEYAATAAGRPRETSYPWGDDPPDCDRAVIGRRAPTGVAAEDKCAARFGPTPVDDPSWAHPGADVTPNGIVGLAGNVTEWTSTGFVAYSHPAWRDAGLRKPVLAQEHAPLRAVRGGSWYSRILLATGSARDAVSLVPSDDIGFRCARPGR